MMAKALKLIIDGAVGTGRGRVLTPPYLGGVAPYAVYTPGLNNEPRVGREISGAGRVAGVDRDATLVGPGAPTDTGLVTSDTTYLALPFGGKDLLTAGSGSCTMLIVTRSAAGADHGHITNNSAGQDSLILQTNSDNATAAYGFDDGTLDQAATSGPIAGRGTDIQTVGGVFTGAGVKVAFGEPGGAMSLSGIVAWTGAAPDGGIAPFRVGHSGVGTEYIVAFYPKACTLPDIEVFNTWAASVLAKDGLV